ncbi:MAG: hypothetical protein QOJ94_2698 [Sphingomonadales bacterium]|jgi:ribosomal protein S27AE|nr:hypothetical protein [Sphingomonadales bacterium]
MSPRRYGCLALLIPLAWLLGPAELVAHRLGRVWPGSEPLAFLPALAAYGFLAWRRARCAECGKSVFELGDTPFYLSSPWPRRRCARCGADLTLPPGPDEG